MVVAGGDVRVKTSSYAGEIRGASHVSDTALPPKSMLEELLVGYDNVDIEKRIRHDNSIFVEKVRPIYSITKERRSNGVLESNREDMGKNQW